MTLNVKGELPAARPADWCPFDDGSGRIAAQAARGAPVGRARTAEMKPRTCTTTKVDNGCIIFSLVVSTSHVMHISLFDLRIKIESEIHAIPIAIGIQNSYYVNLNFMRETSTIRYGSALYGSLKI